MSAKKRGNFDISSSINLFINYINGINKYYISTANESSNLVF